MSIASYLKEARIKPFPFVASLKKYNLSKLRADLIAGLTVAVISIPQGIAYALVAGVHPKYGLYASIIPTIVSSLFRSSKWAVLGPTNSASVVLSSTLTSVAIGGAIINTMPDADKMALVFLLAFLTGIIQVIFGLANVGNLVNFVSFSVIIGFMSGAGTVIGLNQLKNFLGINIQLSSQLIVSTYQVLKHISETNWYSVGLAVFTMLFIIIAKKISPKIPGPLLSITASGILVYIFNLDQQGVKLVGEIPRVMVPFSTFPLNLELLRVLIPSALAFAMLGIVENFSISKSIANMSGEKDYGNQDFVAQGLSNIAGSFFSSIPISCSFIRSITNYNSGAKSRFSDAYSGIFVLLAVLFFSSFAKYIPIPSLAGMIMLIAYSMFNRADLAFTYKASKADRVVLIGTFLSAIILQLQDAIYVGVFLSLILFLRRVSKPQIFKVLPRADGKLAAYAPTAPRCPQLKIFQLDGSIFFGSVTEIESKLRDFNTDQVNVMIMRLKGVRILDATGAYALKKFLEWCKEKNTRVIFTGIRPGVRKILENSGLIKIIGEENMALDTSVAIRLAFEKYIDKNICANCGNKIFKECAKVQSNKVASVRLGEVAVQ